MAELAWRGQVFAVEGDAESLACIQQNVERFGTPNVAIVAGRAPAALESLPPPQAVFVGGTGGEMPAILSHVARVAPPGCRVVLNLAAVEHLSEGLRLMHALGWSPRLTQVSIAHGQPLAKFTRLAPLNPVFILAGMVT
jgi:precorrin-6B methylase 2